MSRSLRILGALLAAQSVLILLTWWPGQAGRSPEPLLALASGDIQAVEIASAGGAAPALRLERQEGGWVIASAGDYPAEATKVEALLERLTDLEVRDPIATSVPSHNALKVGESTYGRRVRLESGEASQALLIGAARSDSIHARRGDEDDVYLIKGVSEFSVSDAPEQYWKSEVVEVPAAEITHLTLSNAHGDIQLTRDDVADWTVDNAPASTRSNDDAINAFVEALGPLRLVQPAGRASELDFEEVARVHWTIAAEDQSLSDGFALGRGEGDRTLLKTDHDPFVVEVSEDSVAAVRDARMEQFVVYVERIDAIGDRQTPSDDE